MVVAVATEHLVVVVAVAMEHLAVVVAAMGHLAVVVAVAMQHLVAVATGHFVSTIYDFDNTWEWNEHNEDIEQDWEQESD